MPRYRAKNPIWLHDRLVEEGEEFVSDRKPGKAWELLADESAPAPVSEPEEPAVAEHTEEKQPARKVRGKGAE